MSISDNIRFIKSQLGEAVSLVVVSKYHTEAEIQQVYDTGHRIFGENKIQDMTQKYHNLPKDIQWHMIGHTQSNKVKYMAPYVALIHSVDSLKLLEEINKQAIKHQRVIDYLFQIHIAQEETKFGVSPEELFSIIENKNFAQLKNVRLRGIMGMATNTDDTSQVRSEFSSLKEIYEQLKARTIPHSHIDTLSMGMSGDYHLAIDCGSTMVRIGSAIFK